MSSSPLEAGPTHRESRARRLGRISWDGPGDPPTPRDALQSYAARLEAEAVRVRRRAEEIDETLAMVRDCIAALPQPIPPPGTESEAAVALEALSAGESNTDPAVAVLRPAARGEEACALHAWMLGRFRVSVGGAPSRAAAPTQVWRLLKYLLIRGGGPVATDVLAETFWSRSARASALQSVYSAASSLRRLLTELGIEDGLVSAGGFYALASHVEISTDVALFRARVAEARREAAHPDRAARLLEDAVAAYRGDFLPGEPYERWAAEEREVLSTTRLKVLERLAAHYDELGRGEQAAEHRQVIVDLDPLREASHAALIHHDLECGRRAEALRRYKELEAVLARELGIEPDVTTRALIADLLVD